MQENQDPGIDAAEGVLRKFQEIIQDILDVTDDGLTVDDLVELIVQKGLIQDVTTAIKLVKEMRAQGELKQIDVFEMRRLVETSTDVVFTLLGAPATS